MKTLARMLPIEVWLLVLLLLGCLAWTVSRTDASPSANDPEGGSTTTSRPRL